MATIEQVEKLRSKANVSYEEAKNALDACGDDILEAMIYLEKQGKVQPPPNEGSYSYNRAESESEQIHGTAANNSKSGSGGESFTSLMGRFFRWCGRMLVKGNTNTFEATRNGQQIISIPVTILVVLLILAFWIVLPLIIIGLFFNCRYSFQGPDLGRREVNNVMDSAADAAESIKRDVSGSSHKQ